MASTARTGLLRHTQLMFASNRLSTSRSIAAQALRSSPSLTRASTPLSCLPRFAPFSTTSHKQIMPPGPQVIQGGINDPAIVPPPSPIHGSYHWSFERLVSIGLVPLTIAPFAAGSISPAIDASLVFLLIIHSHMGFQACIVDYFSREKHPGLRKFFDWTLNIATLLVMWGFYEFETNDVGLTQLVKRVWHAGENDATIGKAELSGLGHDGKLKHVKV